MTAKGVLKDRIYAGAVFAIASAVILLSGVPSKAADLLEPEVPLPVVEDTSLNQAYVKIFGGAAFGFDSEFDGISGAPSPLTTELDYDIGFNVGGAVGYRFGNAFGRISPRVELGVNYVDLGVDSGLSTPPGPSVAQDFEGDQSILFAGVNGLVDYDVTGEGNILPFAGVGFGAAFVDSDVQYNSPAVLFEDSDTTFGLQVIGGVEYTLTDAISVSLEGRYFRAFDAEVTREVPGGPVAVTEGDISGVTANVGIGYRF